MFSATGAIPTVPVGTAGQRMPLISLGTGSGQHGDVENATAMWLQVGGSGIDTAYIYEDEAPIAAGVKAVGASWGSIFLTTKIPCATTQVARANVASNLSHLCRKQAGSGLGQLKPCRLLPAPDHAAGCPRLQPGEANQPHGWIWPDPAMSGSISTHRRSLGVGSVDLLLIHSPRPWSSSPSRCSVAETWAVLEEVHAAGQARSIG